MLSIYLKKWYERSLSGWFFRLFVLAVFPIVAAIYIAFCAIVAVLYVAMIIVSLVFTGEWNP